MAWWNFRRESRADSGLSVPAAWLVDALGGQSTHAAQKVTVEKAIGLSPVFAAVSIIAEQVGQLPFKVYRQIDEGERVEARKHPAWRLLHQRPNSGTPAGRFWSTVTAHLLLYGNAFIEKVRDGGGVVEELVVLHPKHITVKWWPKLRDKTFVVQSPNGSERRELDSGEVLHIMNLSLDGIVGLSVIQACKQSLGTALARDEFEGKFYAQGTVLSGLVQMDGKVSNPAALKRLSESLKILFSGSPQAHGVPVLEEGAEWKSVSSPLKDLQFVQAQNMSRTDIAVMFKLPPNYLGGSSGDSLTYATVEDNQRQFALHAIAPITSTIAEAVSQDPALLPQNVFDAEFVLEAMLRADTQTRGSFYQTMVGIKAMAPSEVRAKENMPPLTAAQRKELNPAPQSPASADDGQQQMDLQAALAGANGNGNGAPGGVND